MEIEFLRRNEITKKGGPGVKRKSQRAIDNV